MHALTALPRLLLVPALLALAVVGAILVVRVHGSGTQHATLVGSGHETTQARTVAPFSGVTLAGDLVVTVTAGPARSVHVHADDNLVGRVSTRVVDHRLVVGTTGSFRTKTPMHVDVATPALASLVLSGNGVLSAHGVDSPRLVVSLPGNGMLHAAGSAGKLVVVLAGNGEAQLGSLHATDARVQLSGDGRVVVRPSGVLDATVSGNGSVVYLGTPKQVMSEITGLGAVNQG